MEKGIIGLAVLLLGFVISIAIMRWAFRINDIVKLLTQIRDSHLNKPSEKAIKE